MTVDDIALWIGRIMMVAGGLALATMAFWLAMEFVWKHFNYGRNALDVYEAVEEWKARNPEKFARWKRRNKAG